MAKSKERKPAKGGAGKVAEGYTHPDQFGSNVQPFVRKRDVSHGDDEDLTREPEMVTAYYEESVWDHLAGARSAPFEAGDQKQVAVKVIDDRGNELLVVKALA
jgi:hypothetical protein